MSQMENLPSTKKLKNKTRNTGNLNSWNYRKLIISRSVNEVLRAPLIFVLKFKYEEEL